MNLRRNCAAWCEMIFVPVPAPRSQLIDFCWPHHKFPFIHSFRYSLRIASCKKFLRNFAARMARSRFEAVNTELWLSFSC